MRYLIYTDVHFSTYSSIIRSRNTVYSKRLETVVKGINWAEQIAVDRGCDEIICLGDFFNSSDLTSEELTALKEVVWSKLPHSFIVGNHDASTKDLEFNSVNALRNLGFNIIQKPSFREVNKNVGLIFIPYLQDDIRKSISEYKTEFNFVDQKCIVLSHNDVKCQYGRYHNETGFDVDDVKENCTLFLNGHIHNMFQFCDNGFNIGNLTGQNFNEDAYTYPHCVWILEINDDGSIGLSTEENPYAYNFYQITISNEQEITEKLSQLKPNAVCSFKCPKELVNILKENIKNYHNIVESKVTYIIEPTKTTEGTQMTLSNSKDHLTQFREFSIERLGEEDLVKQEINRIIGG